MRCPQCHTENRSNAKFCDECGFDLRALTDEQAGGPAAPAPASETPEAVEEAGASDEAPAAAADATAEATEAPADADSAPSAETPRPTFQPLSVAAEAQALFGPKPQAAPSASAEITADLSGLERLVDSSYVPPSYSGRTGDTMQLPRIDDEMVAAARSFRAEADPKEARRARRAQRKAERAQAKREKELQKQGARPLSEVISPIALDETGLPTAGATSAAESAAVPTGTPAESAAAPAASAESAPASTLDAVVPEVFPDAETAPSAADGAGAADKAAALELTAGPVPAGASCTPSDEPSAPRAPRRLSGKMIALIIALVVILGAAVAGGTWAMELWGGRAVPNVVGMTQVDAAAQLEQRGFSTAVVLTKSDEVEGIVLSTDPAAGARAEEGSSVTLSISVARVIPSVLGLQQADAAALFEAEGLENVEYVTVKSNQTEGSVLSVTPTPGERVQSDTAVTVEVAEPFTVPDVAGTTREQAIDALEGEGYTVKVAWYNTEDVAEGTAVSTDPEAGTKLNSGSEVTLYIARKRSTELEGLTRAFFTDSPTMTIDGMPYEISEVSSVEFAGNNTCTFSIVARPFETHTWMFGLGSETRYGNYETITGSISWNDSNDIVATDPTMKQGVS